MVDRLDRALAGRYHVERELGRGGMAVVYLALDLKHHRPVAIKVLSPELAAALGVARFLREIEFAARLNHPHILPLHDSGQADDLLYYVMPYVPGESLRQRLERERQLPIEESVRISAEVAAALSHAHAHDVVHRDIKPENILLSAGYAMVADFGIARAITAAEGDAGPVTTVGITVGTPAYMSPEQAMAQPLDGRSDQYSLACVLYEMLAGAPPFHGPTAQAVLAQHTLEAAPPLRERRGTVSPALERVIETALAKAPADRYPTAAAFQAALSGAITGEVATRPLPAAPRESRRPGRRWRRAAAVAGGAVLIGGAALVVARLPRRPAAAPPPALPSVAVIPFGNGGAASGPDYFVDGFTEDLIGALRRIPGLRVAPATSSYQAVRTTRDPRAIGRQLGADYLVGGTVARRAGAVAVHAVIIGAATGDTLFRLAFDTLRRRDLDVQSDLAGAVARDLRVSLSATGAAPRRPTNDPEAYDLYLQGRFAYEQRRQSSLERAIRLFQQAIGRDTNFALAYSGLADANSLMAAFNYGPPAEYFPRAREAAIEAVEKDSLLPEAQTSLGFVALFWDWDQQDALAHLDRAIALDSGLTQAHLFRSHVFLALHEPDSAVAAMRRAQRLEPFSEIVAVRLATALYFDRQYAEAARVDEQVLATDSLYALAYPDMMRIDLALGRCAAALGLATRPVPFFYSNARGIAGVAAARCGAPALARRILAEIEAERRQGRYVANLDLAVIHLALGDFDQGYAELNQSVNAREFMLYYAGYDPMFDPYRKDPRFTAFINRISLFNRN